MVSFKKLFIATSILLSGVAAAPYPTDTLDVAAAEVPEAPEVPAVNDFAIESGDFAIESRDTDAADAADAAAKGKPKPKPKPKKCLPTRNALERRVLHAGSNANSIVENEFVTAMQIKNNGGKATVADLSGCTALFFYMGTTLRRVVHVLCGEESTDAKTAAQAAAGSDSVTIGAATEKHFGDAEAAVKAGKPGITVHKHIYKTDKVTETVAVTLHGADGSTGITDGTGARICRQK